MMSFGEIVTVSIVVGVAALIIIAAVYILVKAAIKQARQAGAEQERADTNAEAVKQFREATDVILRPDDLDATIERLRNGTF